MDIRVIVVHQPQPRWQHEHGDALDSHHLEPGEALKNTAPDHEGQGRTSHHITSET